MLISCHVILLLLLLKLFNYHHDALLWMKSKYPNIFLQFRCWNDISCTVENIAPVRSTMTAVVLPEVIIWQVDKLRCLHLLWDSDKESNVSDESHNYNNLTFIESNDCFCYKRAKIFICVQIDIFSYPAEKFQWIK